MRSETKASCFLVQIAVPAFFLRQATGSRQKAARQAASNRKQAAGSKQHEAESSKEPGSRKDVGGRRQLDSRHACEKCTLCWNMLSGWLAPARKHNENSLRRGQLEGPRQGILKGQKCQNWPSILLAARNARKRRPGIQI